jgi:uncharacterized membrane protein
VTQLGAFTGVFRDALAHLAPTNVASPGYVRYNIPRVPLDAADVGVLTTQVMTSVPIFLGAGETVTNLTFTSGATAAGTPTNWWFALYYTQATPALLQQTADQTSGAWAANTTKTVALAAPVSITKSGFYWAAVMVKATTPPTLIGARFAPALVTGERVLAQTSGSALAATAPATIATPTALTMAPLAAAT